VITPAEVEAEGRAVKIGATVEKRIVIIRPRINIFRVRGVFR